MSERAWDYDPTDGLPSAAVVCRHCRMNHWRLFEGDRLDAGGTHRYARLRCATPGCEGRLRWVRRVREP